MENWQEQQEQQLQHAIESDWQPMRTPRYDANFVYDLKGRIPATRRSWDKAEKVWYIHPDWLEQAADVWCKHYNHVGGITPKMAWGILHLRENAPRHLIQCAADCLLENETRERERQRITNALKALTTL